MNALEWLKERQRQSLENQALFNATPFEQTAHGFKARNYKQPEVKNKLVQKRGEDTLTKEWVSPYPQRESTLNISALPNNRVPPMPRGGEWARTTGMWDVPAKTPLSHADISNLRAMREAEVTPTPPQQLRPTGPSEQYWNLRNLSGGYDRHPRPQQVRPQTPPTQSNSYLEDWPLNENQWNTLTDQQSQNAGQGRNSYVFGDTTAPGVGSVPNKTLFSMGIPLPNYDEWWAAKKKDEMLQKMIRQRLDPSTLRQPYQRSGGRY